MEIVPVRTEMDFSPELNLFASVLQLCGWFVRVSLLYPLIPCSI